MLKLILSAGLAMFAAMQLQITHAAEGDVKKLVEQVVASAGGEEKLLKVFKFRERVLITSTPAAPVTADEKGNRTSVVQVAGEWWLGTTKRGKDKVRVLAWAWTLQILLDPKSKIEAIEDSTINGKSVLGLRVTESIKEPIELYFDKDQKQLIAIDYTDTRHIFSDWKKTEGGFSYPTHAAGYRFTNKATRTTSDKQWYQTDILELTPLPDVPAELKGK